MSPPVGKGQRSTNIYRNWGANEIGSLMPDVIRYTAFKSVQVKGSWENSIGSVFQTLPVEYM